MSKKEKSLGIEALYHLIAIVFLFIVASIYFSPSFQGKVLVQSDITQFQGMSQELREYYNNDGESSTWTGSMFSGMPAYQIGVWGGSPNFLDYIEYPFKVVGSNTVGPVFTGMLMAYILFCFMGVGIIPAILGAIAYSLSSYNIIILDAGHVTKAWAIAYIPLVLSAFVAAYKNKYLLSAFFMAIGLALEIKSNHLQITYYLAILCVFLYLGLFVHFILTQKITGLFKTTGALAIGVLIGVLCNLGSIYANYEMSLESIRGKSELTQPTEGEKQSSGLDKDYTFQWSYGKMETLSLLVPNIYGGASGGMLSTDSHLYKYIKSNYPSTPLDKDGIQAPTYWGEQPFTSGPVYFGAIVCFLFVLGMIIINSRMKWALFAATIFFVFLAWGKNFELFNDWFFYHFPMYSKFRAVSTALVIPAITVVIVAVWGLFSFSKNLENTKKISKAIYISGGITGGICLLLMIMPGVFGFNFMSSLDPLQLNGYPDWFYNLLVADRKELLFYDAFRSLVFIALGMTCLILAVKFRKDTSKLTIFGLVFVVLVLVDLWPVDKRYLNNDKFQIKESNTNSKFFEAKIADKIIWEDENPSYRVLNLNSPFAETRTSYFHKSIGGYHAAKLKRYQELIDNNIKFEIDSIIGVLNPILSSSENSDFNHLLLIFDYDKAFSSNKALNMLNAKYIVLSPDYPPLVNPYAMGNAWFVNDYKFVDDADSELASLEITDLHKTAIINKKFQDQLQDLSIIPDSSATIVLTDYKPNYLKYKSDSKSEQLAVLSEIYYPKGWEASIDGKPVPHLGADWILRAIRVPSGSHDIEFKFIPYAYNTARVVSAVSSGVLLLFVVGFVVMFFVNVSRKEK